MAQGGAVWIVFVIVALASLASPACQADSESTCEPGSARECACDASPGPYHCGGAWGPYVSIGISGEEACLDDGFGWGRCNCLPPLDQGCVDACTSAPDAVFCGDMCSKHLAMLKFEMPSEVDPTECHDAFIRYWECHLSESGNCDDAILDLDAACRPSGCSTS